MSDRLKQIWAGFEAGTDRRLTGKGVEHIVVPRRYEDAEIDAMTAPDGVAAPAQRAFARLAADLERKAQRFKGARGRGRDEPATFASEERFYGDETLARGLRATAMRVERSDLDYATFMSTGAGREALKRTRPKKRFGLF